MFQEFRNSLGENPVGTNAEITKALLGDNLKQVRLTLPKGSSVNDAGEMCDGRGIPFFSINCPARKWKSAPRARMRKCGLTMTLSPSS